MEIRSGNWKWKTEAGNVKWKLEVENGNEKWKSAWHLSATVVSNGVYQGRVLSPLLFAVYLDGLLS